MTTIETISWSKKQHSFFIKHKGVVRHIFCLRLIAMRSVFKCTFRGLICWNLYFDNRGLRPVEFFGDTFFDGGCLWSLRKGDEWFCNGGRPCKCHILGVRWKGQKWRTWKYEIADINFAMRKTLNSIVFEFTIEVQ